MVGERDDPMHEAARIDAAREALGILNSHILEGGAWSESLRILEGIAEEEFDQTGDDDALVHVVVRNWGGAISIAWELLAIRERETGVTTAASLEELGRIFTPNGSE